LLLSNASRLCLDITSPNGAMPKLEFSHSPTSARIKADQSTPGSRKRSGAQGGLESPCKRRYVCVKNG
jgi:hypothetical protein